MKLSTKEKTLIIGGAAEVIPMTINQSAKGFRALMSGLYSDPIQSIIREISTNAYDAHVEAGITARPFLVHLPTQADRRFRVRDYGRGIKHDAMRRIYTSVLSSTKDGDNTQVGAWGLGSKSPLAYVDSFIVTTYSGTETRSYLVATGTDGSPQLICYDPEPSTEESGVEVIIDVSPNDVTTFHKKAAFVYRGFPVTPEGITLPAKAEESIASGRNRIEKINNYSEKRLNILQGCVLYPVDLNKVCAVTSLPRWMGELTVEVPIGSVDITPSRESIIYERGTCISIGASVESVIKLLDKEISRKIASSKNLWEASKSLHRVTSMFGIGKDATWGGKKIPDNLELGAKVSRLSVRRAAERYHLGKIANPKAVTVSRSSLEIGTIRADELYHVKQVFVADLLTRDIRAAMEVEYNNIGRGDDIIGFLAGEDYHSVIARIEEYGIPIVRFETSSVPKAPGTGWRPMFGCLVSSKSKRWSKQAPDELKPLDELLKKHPDAPVLVTNSWKSPPRTAEMLALCEKTIVTTIKNTKAVEGRKTLQEAANERAQEILDADWPSDDAIMYVDIDRRMQSLIKNLRGVGYQSEFLAERKGGNLFKEAATLLGRDYVKLIRASKRAEGLIALQERYPLISHLPEYDVVSMKNAVLEYIEGCDRRRPG